jgi:hypothetical protein
VGLPPAALPIARTLVWVPHPLLHLQLILEYIKTRFASLS